MIMLQEDYESSINDVVEIVVTFQKAPLVLHLPKVTPSVWRNIT